MHNKVVFRAAAALNDAGLTVLRINFRGVGQSTGKHDEGRGERDDVRAGLDYLSQQYPGLRITVCGFSFGSRVGLEVGIQDPRVSYLIGIGTPLEKYDFSFLAQCRKPLLLVHGDTHNYQVDQPFTDATGATIGNITRVETYGSPIVGWVKVTVTPGDPRLFGFASHIQAIVP